MKWDEFWFWFGVWTSILALVIAGTVTFTDLVPGDWEPRIVKICADLFAINNVILTAAKMRGYLNSKTASIVPDASTVAKVLIASFVLSMFLPIGSAHAQMKQRVAAPAPVATATDTPAKPCLLVFDPLKLCGALTGKPEEDMQRVAKRIAGVTKADLNYAMAKAKAANTAASKIRLQCIQAISDANDQANGASLKNTDGTDMVRPDPALVTAIEDVAELVDNLSPQGVLFTSCAGAAQMFKTNTLAAINAIVTGAAGIAALPAGL
jgi:hypothetical protein